MQINDLKQLLRENGIVGAGGAGFPSYAKLDLRASAVILNCAECEPLLKLHRQMLEKYAYEIVSTLSLIADTVEAEEFVIAVKGSYKGAVSAVKNVIGDFKKGRIGILPEMYPAGDEVVTIYETTGRVVPPGNLPISVGCIVYNVETVYNMYRAINSKLPVTHKYVTVAGEVKEPKTIKAPLGTSFKTLIDMCGGVTAENTRIISGGPMTGNLADEYGVVTKTTNGILVMPENHEIVLKRLANAGLEIKRAMSVCCQCRACTELCSRNLLGQPIEPHKFMRALSRNVITDPQEMVNTLYCSSCGICEMYACPQGLNPRSLIADYKMGLRKNGIKPTALEEFDDVRDDREYRLVPMHRLKERLDLIKYDINAPITEEVPHEKHIKIMLSQHIGAPAKPIVKPGDNVTAAQVVAKTDDSALGVNIHAPENGAVAEITDKFIIIAVDTGKE